jgi:hypothetical protein
MDQAVIDKIKAAKKKALENGTIITKDGHSKVSK